jgi:hypothetical protein
MDGPRRGRAHPARTRRDARGGARHGQLEGRREASGGSSRRARNGDGKRRFADGTSQRPLAGSGRWSELARIAVFPATTRAPRTGCAASLHGAAFRHGPVAATTGRAGEEEFPLGLSCRPVQQQVPPPRHPRHRQWWSCARPESGRAEERLDAVETPVPKMPSSKASATGASRHRNRRTWGPWGGGRTGGSPAWMSIRRGVFAQAIDSYPSGKEAHTSSTRPLVHSCGDQPCTSGRSAMHERTLSHALACASGL